MPCAGNAWGPSTYERCYDLDHAGPGGSPARRAGVGGGKGRGITKPPLRRRRRR